MRKRIPYLLIFIITFVSGLFLFFKGNGLHFVRNYGGDFLVVICIYAAIKSVYHRLSPVIAGSGIFLFASSIEIMQGNLIPKYFNTSSKLVAATLGSTFDWGDMIAYVVGIVVIASVDYMFFYVRKYDSL